MIRGLSSRMVAGVLLCSCLMLLPNVSNGQSREEKVRADREKVLEEGFWIYNDLERGFAQARRTGKPLLVVLRCIPCVECVKLDDELVDRDPVIRPLLEKYVCVRIVSTNGLDLDTFQYDTDQSFAVFLLNADKTVYGRFGTRSHRTEWYGDVSLNGLAEALTGGLQLHAAYPQNRATLAAKTGQPLEFKSPEKYPSLKNKYSEAIDFSTNVVKACIHCHQIGDARRELFRSKRQPIPENVFFPYPHPKSIGLILDSEKKATVLKVTPDSWAADSGFEAGDEIVSMAGQPLLSIADVQWVLDSIDPAGGQVATTVLRDGKNKRVMLTLPKGWRQAGDISWRVSTWGMRRMFLGGLKLAGLTSAPDKNSDTDKNAETDAEAAVMDIEVEHVGQYGPHATAKKAGFHKGDRIIEFDGRTDLRTEADLLWHCNQNYQPGDRIPVVVQRGNQRRELTLRMQR